MSLVDQVAEDALAAELGKIRPQACVVGEEGSASDSQILGSMQNRQSLWIVDPLDGTRNFAHAQSQFAVMVAYVAEEYTTQAGWILDPLRCFCITACLGHGVFRNGHPIGEVLSGTQSKPMEEILPSKGIYPTDTLCRLFCALQEYILITEGVAVSSFYRRPKPWDHAAGVLIYSELGGYAALLSGAPYDLLAPDSFGLLLAPSRAAWRYLAANLVRTERPS